MAARTYCMISCCTVRLPGNVSGCEGLAHLLGLWPGVAGDILKVCHAPEAHAALDLGNDFSLHSFYTVMQRITCMRAAII